MKKRNAAIVMLVCGVFVLFLAVFGIYKDFFEPRLGPLGTGHREWTVYAGYTAALLGGLCYTLFGAYLLLKVKASQ